MSDVSFTLSTVTAVTREIRGDTTYFANLFLRMSSRYPECRIVAEPNGGVSIRFEGDWRDRWRFADGDKLPKLITENRAKRRGWLARFFGKPA